MIQTKKTQTMETLETQFNSITNIPVKHSEIISNYGFITDTNNGKWSVKLTSKGNIKSNSLRKES